MFVLRSVRALPGFRGESKASTWLYGIALNLARNHASRSPHHCHCFEDEQALARAQLEVTKVNNAGHQWPPWAAVASSNLTTSGRG